MGISPDAMDLLLPMHLRFDASGIVTHLAPGLTRLAGDRQILGAGLLDGFTIIRPVDIDTADGLLRHAGQRLRLCLTEGRKVRLKGIAQPLPGGGGLVDLALDLSELSDLGGAPLTNSDFSPTDPTVDMLYLIEANHAAMAETHRLIERLQGAKSQAETQAFTDTLTGLANRRALDRVLDRCVTGREPFSLTQVDLDYFKAVNDTMGHAAGDAVLRRVAARLREATRQTDTVARVGGDEFVIVFRGLTDPDKLRAIGGRIIDSLETPVIHDGRECRISASLGTAISIDYDAPDIKTMMADSDEALYAVKKAGRAGHLIAGRCSDAELERSGESDAA